MRRPRTVRPLTESDAFAVAMVVRYGYSLRRAKERLKDDPTDAPAQSTFDMVTAAFDVLGIDCVQMERSLAEAKKAVSSINSLVWELTADPSRSRADWEPSDTMVAILQARPLATDWNELVRVARRVADTPNLVPGDIVKHWGWWLGTETPPAS